LLCVQCQTPDDGQRDCPKHVEFYYKNKFDNLVRLVGFIIRINLVNLVEGKERVSGQCNEQICSSGKQAVVQNLEQY